jgi:hypothetical protein
MWITITEGKYTITKFIGPLDAPHVQALVTAHNQLEDLKEEWPHDIALENLTNSVADQITDLQLAEAKVDRQFFKYTQQVMCKTRAGQKALDHINAYKVPVLFFPRVPNSMLNINTGFFNSLRKDVKVYYCMKPDDAARITVHEVRHHWQRHYYPELFLPDLNVVDAFVAVKLIEIDASAVQREHEIEMRFRDDVNYIWGTRNIPKWASPHIAKEIRHRQIRNGGRKHFEDTMYAKPNWAYYERRFCKPEILTLLRSGQFEERARSSRFLAPSFLECFLSDSSGESIVPRRPNAFFGRIANCVTRVNHPILVLHANQNTLGGQTRNLKIA